MNRITILVLVLLVVVSCKKDEKLKVDSIYNKWEVSDYISVESSYHPKNNNYNPVIEFYKNGSFTLKLDKNSCVGTFSLSGENEIIISGPGCTEICCDSDFSNKIAMMLPQVTSYSFEGNKLQLNVPQWGWINMELH